AAELRRAGYADRATRFPLIDLDEPDKEAVLAWRPGQPVTRKAFVVARRERTIYEAVGALVALKGERRQAIPELEGPGVAEGWGMPVGAKRWRGAVMSASTRCFARRIRPASSSTRFCSGKGSCALRASTSNRPATFALDRSRG